VTRGGAVAVTIDDIFETFELLPDWEDRYRYLIDLGRQLPPFPDAQRTEATKVQGCLSQVWMVSEVADGRVQIVADSDAAIVKGLIAVLVALYSGHTPQEIVDTPVEPTFEKLDFGEHISMNRRNGFFSMVQRIRGLAVDAARHA